MDLLSRVERTLRCFLEAARSVGAVMEQAVAEQVATLLQAVAERIVADFAAAEQTVRLVQAVAERIVVELTAAEQPVISVQAVAGKAAATVPP